MKKLLLISISLLFFLCTHLLATEQAAFKIIVNNASDVTSMRKEEVANIFLKKVSKWKNGHKIFPVDQVDSSPLRESFSKQIPGKSVTAIKSYWQQQIYSGREVPPPEVANDNAVIIYVQGNVDAIGYVSANAITTGKVKVLEISQ